jgi:putative membrane protein
LFISSVGAWYEVLEWFAMALFCKQTDVLCLAALTQGDIWDAQKDITYAILGSITALLVHSIYGSKTSETGKLN